ncbi:MAG: AMP-binding protein [Lentisphaerae bacterium]|nr:AMP-binding protein [Lentisphaerota bacterium]
MNSTQAFLQARDFLITHRLDYDAACRGFRWPQLDTFNWALDYFDVIARHNDRPALRLVNDAGVAESHSFATLSRRSNQVANFLIRSGVRRGERLLVMLPNVTAMWEVTLAALKLGAVVSPTAPLLPTADLQDRINRGDLRHAVADPAGVEKLAGLRGLHARIVVGHAATPGWTTYAGADQESDTFVPEAPTRADDPFLLYFTSGTTARPKLVLHTHRTYPVGHLSTMYWLGLQPTDVHFNISSPGWAKHAWSSFFAPWNAGACIFVLNLPRFDARKVLGALAANGVTSLCAPPTVWRMLVLEDLKSYPVKVRELASAGEPLNPEIIEQVRAAWGLTIRDGYGQTETSALVGNSPGQPVKAGSMGRPLPGYHVALLDADGHAGNDGEISIGLEPRPAGLMAAYADSAERTAAALGNAFYRTSDTASRDADGYYWYIGRSDDVFKSSDYRISPFELESILIEHEVVAEAAVVPSPDPLRLSVPKAFVLLKPGIEPSRELALSILRFTRERLPPYERIRRLEFCDLPKTISGKIRRVQLRAAEAEHHARQLRRDGEFREEDFPELKHAPREAR